MSLFAFTSLSSANQFWEEKRGQKTRSKSLTLKHNIDWCMYVQNSNALGHSCIQYTCSGISSLPVYLSDLQKVHATLSSKKAHVSQAFNIRTHKAPVYLLLMIIPSKIAQSIVYLIFIMCCWSFCHTCAYWPEPLCYKYSLHTKIYDPYDNKKFLYVIQDIRKEHDVMFLFMSNKFG